LKTVIYADVLVIINLIVNYLLLRASSFISGHNIKIRRILISSAIGGLFSLIIFAENLSVATHILLKILFFVIMVLTAFGTKNIKSFLKCCASFALVNFGFAGIMFALCTSVIPNASIYKNGIVYFDISLLTLTVSITVCYTAINLISKFTKSRIPQKCIYDIKIFYKNETAECKALFDSGNTLCESFSGKPVIIAESELIKSLCKENDITSMKNFRLIPFSTIKNAGALPAFLADKIEINIKGKWIESKEIYIAVTNKKIVSGEYSALFGIPFFETVESEIKGGFAAV
jgi:stage II sporulation protein GA (sporulation sigma-E factor processing peptidase)